MAFAVILIATEAIFHWSTSQGLPPESICTHRAALLELPRQHASTWTARAVLRCEHEHRGQQIMLTCMQHDTTDVSRLLSSDLLIHARLTTPCDSHNPGEMEYGTWLLRHGVNATAFCYASQWKAIAPISALPLTTRLLQWQHALTSRLERHVQGDMHHLLAAMTLGNRSELSKSLRADFSAAGVSHIIALSGLHLSILTLLFTWGVARWLRRWRWATAVSVAGGLMLMAIYVLMAGAPPSLVRSALMLCMALICSTLERRALSLNNLSLAALILLLWDARTIFDAGFQLSFAAVAGILVATHHLPFPRRWQKAFSTRMELTENARIRIARQRLMEALSQASSPQEAQQLSIAQFMPTSLPLSARTSISLRLTAGHFCNMLWGMTIVSLGAQLATLPLVAYHFHQIPTYGILINYLVIPLAYPILLGGIALMALPSAWGALSAAIASIVRWALMSLIAIVSWVAEMPGSSIAMPEPARPPLVIYQRFSTPEIYCAQGTWLASRDSILSSPWGSVVKVTRKPSRFAPTHPLKVDVLWLCHGAGGHLADWIRSYAPQTLVLDATLSDYYRETFLHEAEGAGLTVHDVRHEGAYILEH